MTCGTPSTTANYTYTETLVGTAADRPQEIPNF